MRVLVTGSSGFIGTALVAALEQRGDKVVRLTRGASGHGTATWDPDAGTISTVAFDGVDAVVHLAGEGIGEKKWSEAQKQRILDSRVNGTTLLARTLAELPAKPAVLVSGSAVGYYGDRGDDELDEGCANGDDFLAGVCRQWEAAAQPVTDAGIRLATLRTGIVLDRHGGTLKRMLLPFRFGLGGRLGSGKQWMSWVTLADHIAAVLYALDHDTVRGPVNVTAPRPVTNSEFTKALGAAVHRPTVLPTPLLPLRLVYGGELVDALLLAGQRVVPQRLLADGFVFTQPEIGPALKALLAPMPTG